MWLFAERKQMSSEKFTVESEIYGLNPVAVKLKIVKNNWNHYLNMAN